jgi:hypothetical protein
VEQILRLGRGFQGGVRPEARENAGSIGVFRIHPRNDVALNFDSERAFCFSDFTGVIQVTVAGSRRCILLVRVGDLFTVNWGRKGALLLLAIVVAWTTLPASACLFTARTAGRPACCSGMAQDCPMCGMGLNVCSCRIDGRNAAFTPVPPYSPEHAQPLAFVSPPTRFDLPAAARTGRRNALESPPPKFQSGSVSILRI